MADNNNNNNNNNEGSSLDIIPFEAKAGLNFNASVSNVGQGELTFALNAVTSNSEGNSVNYQNESGNTLYVTFPEGYKVNGEHLISEANIILFWLVNGDNSEMGTVSEGVYTKYINDPCLNLSEDFPIHKAFHRVTPTGIEVYWTDANNERRYINLSVTPYLETPNPNGCGNIIHTDQIDCNKLAVQPTFTIPQIDVVEVDTGGDLTAGTYQFCVQYGSADSEPYTSFYSITDPLPIGNTQFINPVFNYKTGNSIKVNISNIDTSDVYQFINVAVIKTINLISSVELVGTYRIDKDTLSFIYNGEAASDVRLSMDDIFEKYPIYDKADDIFLTGSILGWSGLTTTERINYQSIWNGVTLNWQTYRLPVSEGYKLELTSESTKGYFRDEVYALEGCFYTRKGYQTDKFHIPGRIANTSDVLLINNNDVLSLENLDTCSNGKNVALPAWQVYNTATVTDYDDSWKNSTDQNNCYNGPYQYGQFGYYESEDTYPCDVELWGSLAGLPIRHHKMPDSTITHIHDNSNNIYPLGIRVDVQQIVDLINASNLTQSQKDDIVGFKILRADRTNNKSVVARGLINNVLKYSLDGNFTSNGSATTIQDQVNNLIDQAYTLLVKAVNILAFQGKAKYYHELEDTIEQLTALKGLTIGSTAYNTSLTNIVNQLTDVENNTKNDEAVAYVSGGITIVQSIQSFQDLQLDITSNIATTTYSDILYYPNYSYNDVSGNDNFLNNTLIDDSSKSRFAFHSPDTHFYQPYLGNLLKLETAEEGIREGHIVEVKNHSKYQFLSTVSYVTASISALVVGFASGEYGVSDQPFDGTAAFTAYKTILDILYKVSPLRNFCFQFNSVGLYENFHTIPNNGNKIRALDIATYLVPGIQSVSDDHLINNYQRESSVYLKTNSDLPYTHEQDGNIVVDSSNTLIPTYSILPENISSYYATIGKSIANQYGEIYSYDSIDTGYQALINLSSNTNGYGYVFGGDCFINQFAYKSKIPFFTDNRVGFPDESDIFYDQIPNVGNPKYWFSTDVTSHNSFFSSVFGVKPHNFFWERDSAFTDYGNIFLFSYNIPYFYCESEVNVDFRQAFNDKEGDFYPRVGTGIPDDWLQEKNVTIQQDNTYFYNKTYSKQNKENYFSSIPPDYYTDGLSVQYLSHSAIYSDVQKEIVNYRHNNWLLYKPVSRFDFPKNFGAIISIDGVWDEGVLVRYENAAQMYNAYITIDTSSPKAAYLGNDKLFKGAPPVDFSITEIGYGGGWNKMMIRTEIGIFLCDLKRGNFMLLERGNRYSRPKMINISGKLSLFFTKELKFNIKNTFPDFPVDNHFKDVGLTGTYDNALDRLLITKRDYQCIDSKVIYQNGILSKNGIEVQLTDSTYFVDKSFTFSFGLDIKNFVSFHSYIPNYYIPSFEGFYTGINEPNATVWTHLPTNTIFNNFYGSIAPYIIESPYAYKFRDEILQCIKDYSRVYLYSADSESFIETDDTFFNQAILYNDQGCSGILELVPKPRGSLHEYMKYPKYFPDKKVITFTKSDNFYNYNTFWSMVKDKTQPIFIPSKEPSMLKDLNQTNMNYSKMSFGKAPLRSKNLKVRHILNNTSSYKIISELQITENQESFK